MNSQKEESSILNKLIAIQSSLPTKQEKLCSYILDNHREIGLLTVKELSNRAGVGTTTVMRLVKALDFHSFSDLKKEFYRNEINKSDKWINVQKSFDANEKGAHNIISDVAQENIRLINESINTQLIENFEKGLDLIEAAPRINILGLRTYKGIAIYLENLLIEFQTHVQQLSHDSESMVDRILQCREDEVIIIFAFSNYLQRTIDAALAARKQNVKVILITDHLSCPIAEYADTIMTVNTGGIYFTISPIVMLIEAIVVELGKRTSSYSIAKIHRLVNELKDRQIILK